MHTYSYTHIHLHTHTHTCTHSITHRHIPSSTTDFQVFGCWIKTSFCNASTKIQKAFQPHSQFSLAISLESPLPHVIPPPQRPQCTGLPKLDCINKPLHVPISVASEPGWLRRVIMLSSSPLTGQGTFPQEGMSQARLPSASVRIMRSSISTQVCGSLPTIWVCGYPGDFLWTKQDGGNETNMHRAVLAVEPVLGSST